MVYRLTQRELEVLKLLATGMKNHEIAKQLFMSVPTVKTHIRKLYAKLNATNAASAVNIAWQHRILQIEVTHGD